MDSKREVKKIAEKLSVGIGGCLHSIGRKVALLKSEEEGGKVLHQKEEEEGREGVVVE